MGDHEHLGDIQPINVMIIARQRADILLAIAGIAEPTAEQIAAEMVRILRVDHAKWN